jgi:hypothetical protein
MKQGPNISPVAAVAIIVVAVAAVGFIIFKMTVSSGKVQLSSDQVSKMNQMMGQQKAEVGPGGPGRPSHSVPPGMPGPK